jgi:transcriptional repressor NrdR
MFCVNCFHKNTQVVNSRPSKKHPKVWRRRQCSSCGAIFTTHERPSLAENKEIYTPTGTIEAFNLGRLILSIAQSFTHNPHAAKYDSLWLAQTVEETLSSQREIITTEDIEAITHETLKRFDELAAVQYAAKHQLLTSTRRRPGRPSLHERAPRTDVSPSP